MSLDTLCQSCAMPLTDDEQRGKNADGTMSADYCKYCYPNGAFNNPNETMEEMINTCIPFMVEHGGKTEEEAKTMMSQTLPLLKRWK